LTPDDFNRTFATLHLLPEARQAMEILEISAMEPARVNPFFADGKLKT
jgi:hypothetical protein